MKYIVRNRWFWFFMCVFILHQVLQKAIGLRIVFLDNYLDDLLCMPILLSGWLAEQHDLFAKKRLGLLEIIFLCLFISLIFEGLLPHLYPHYTADVWDVVCYGLGGAFFYFAINPRN